MEIIISNTDAELIIARPFIVDANSDAVKINLSSGRVLIEDDIIEFNNILELLSSLEKKNLDVDKIFIVGLISSFSSEINIRTAFSGFIGLAKKQLSYIDESSRITGRLSVLNRCFLAMNEEPFVNNTGEHIELKFLRPSNRWSSFCLNETKKNVTERTLLHGDFLNKLSEHLMLRKPFSFIRLNHCENRILGYDFTFPKDEVDITYSIQFGNSLSTQDTSYISSRMKEAVKNATVIGAPKDTPLSSSKLNFLEFTTKVHLLNLSLLQNQFFTNVNIHYDLGQNRKFKEILQSAEKIVAITCRDISLLEKNIGKPIHKIDVPAEHRFKGNENITSPHYPDFFIDIENEIDEIVSPGVIVLVGAGILGKIYCDTILKNGGIAIDVGSLMDAIENIPTRGDGFDKFKFWWND